MLLLTPARASPSCPPLRSEQVPHTFDENILCFLVPPLGPLMAEPFPRLLLGSALLYFSHALGSTYLSADFSRAGLQFMTAITFLGLVLTLKVSILKRFLFVVLFVLVALTLLYYSLPVTAAKMTN